GEIVLMYGWFESFNFLPNQNLKSIFIGTHFTENAQNFLKRFLAYFPDYFDDKEVGCRDIFTLEFLQKLGIKAYFSRCLTSTLPKRKEKPTQTKVFFVGFDDKKLLSFIPKHLLENAEFINQQRVKLQDDWTEENCFKMTQDLLARYENKAKIIITSALHCASPATAMGIPVVLIRTVEEQKNRFSALENIIPIYSIEDLKRGKIDFNPQAPDIEPLKEAMLENVRLSVLKEQGEQVDEARLKELRAFIASFKAN
ncbi:polysaccharide pyruvyl transferase family protein, partial [Helicobacter sp. CLO-3]|uniref:polysaccharide pyruvyl transferase family protein n=3 Tax=unclassified Helicobacter TaxID=2593540 RepID=UPI00115FFCE0